MQRTPLDANKLRLQELKKRRQDRLRGMNANESVTSQTRRPDMTQDKRQFSLQRSEGVQLPRSGKETYEMEVQCILQTRSMDSKPRERDSQIQQKTMDLLQPKEHRRRRDEHHQNQAKHIQQLNQEQLQSLVKSKHFTEFFNKSSKLLEKVLDHGDGDMIQLYLREGIKSKEASDNDVLSHSLTFFDKNYTINRVVTDFDWSAQIPQLFLTSYSQNQEGSIKDHVGVILLWSLSLKSRPEFYCFCQSAVTSAKFFPFSTNTVLGGCYNGQLLLWDVRAKTMPVQRSGISADAHKYPVNSLNVIGTQIANNVVSASSDGMMCTWDIKQFSKPVKISKLSSVRSARMNKQVSTSVGLKKTAELGSGSIMDKTKDQTHDINITSCQFPTGDANNYYVGSLNGVMYKNALHNKPNDKMAMYDEHNGPISGISVNNPSSEFQALSGLVLTSSFDWSVKLWSPNSTQSMRTFQSSEDYIYDVSWNPINPSIFATVNNEGYIDLFDLTKDLELPVSHKKIDSMAQNKCKWNKEGSAIITGDSVGNVNLLTLGEKYRRLDHSKLEDFENVIFEVRDKTD